MWDPIRQRIRTAGRCSDSNDASFLVYSLIDAIVDDSFPSWSFRRPPRGAGGPGPPAPEPGTIQEIHRIKRELLLLRRALGRCARSSAELQREPHECLSEITQTYFRDVYDHAVQIIDLIETYREIASDLTETYMSSMSNRMNEIMKVLTIIGTIFIPLTFLAGVYGMNFHHFPELDWPYAYAAFWAICLATAGGMIPWFRRRGWI